MNSVYHFCCGESHKSTHKPCQDYAYADCSESLSLAIVSDGHGGERYFRSNVGSRLLVEITEKAIREFVSNVDCTDASIAKGKNVFEGMPFTSYSKAEPQDADQLPAHKLLMWLFSSIICQWNERIEEHAMNYDLNDWEIANVPEKYQEEFARKRLDKNRTDGFEKTYGCTLMSYAQTKSYWFAFHIGDGKCVTLHRAEGNRIVWKQPIPWDERCFLNKTTSICDSNALEEFRYCYQGNGQFPKAVFLGSDGLDDTYGDGERLASFYMKMYQELAKSGRDSVKRMLEEDLPVISQRGSKDDMSIACVYDDVHASKNSERILKSQIDGIKEELDAVLDQIRDLESKIKTLRSALVLSESQKIDLDYAIKAREKANSKKEALSEKYSEMKGDKGTEKQHRTLFSRFKSKR